MTSALLSRSPSVPRNGDWIASFEFLLFYELDGIPNPVPSVDLWMKGLELFRTLAEPTHVYLTTLPSTRPRKLRSFQKNLDLVRSEMIEGRIHYLGLSSQDDSVGFMMSLAGPVCRRLYAGDDPKFESIRISVSPEVISANRQSADECLNYLVEAWSIANGLYGFADYFAHPISGYYTNALVEAQGASLGAKVLTVERWMPRCNLRNKVPDVCWFNMLNSDHITAIGGMGQIRTAFGAALERPLAHGGTVIRLEASPLTDRTPTRLQEISVLSAGLSSILEVDPARLRPESRLANR